MSFKILVMGLSGSGKTTFSKKLSKALKAKHLNADAIRKEYNDWDFSSEGRIRQARRIHKLSIDSDKDYVVMDFICPLKESRDIVDADYIIWMNTIDSSKFNDTDQVFVPPKKAHIVTDFNYNMNTIIKRIK